MKGKSVFIGATCALLVLLGGMYVVLPKSNASQGPQKESDTIWTCAMHPQIKMPNPGQCPICGMELIPLEFGASGGGNTVSLTLSDRARKLAEVETTVVSRGEVHLNVLMYGKLEFDESRVAHITSRTAGRIERLFLDFTGISVKKGDHMVELYSPELVTAQQELIQASQTKKNMRADASPFLKKTLSENLESSREKLHLWGLSEKQINEIEEMGEPEEVLTINAPIGGIVVHKEAIEGRYVKEGTKIYTIADLTELWLVLDAYESDLGWLRHGQEVEFYTEASPGKPFKGTVSFIDPVVSEKKRSVRVRANVSNPNGVLKPGMFVRATVKPVVSATGSVVSKRLEGKWIGPMHPQIVSDEQGTCPTCGMDLVTAESLGYVSSDSENGKLPLLIPITAPLITGKRAIVYVEDPEKPGLYTARVITLGPRAEKQYIVYDGLHEGERVVTNGSFKIDSASQILAKPSMMMPEGGAKPMKGHSH
jgi:Cu(I)/Ag(I) efflux system membrane fusion protein